MMEWMEEQLYINAFPKSELTGFAAFPFQLKNCKKCQYFFYLIFLLLIFRLPKKPKGYTCSISIRHSNPFAFEIPCLISTFLFFEDLILQSLLTLYFIGILK